MSTTGHHLFIFFQSPTYTCFNGLSLFFSFHVSSSRRLEPPQSELFEAGFQCVRYYNSRNRVLVGTEDGAINIFNNGEWGNISDRFPIKGSNGQAQRRLTIDRMEVISWENDEEIVLTGSSDGKVRILNIFPNKIIAEGECHSSCVESLAANARSKQVASSDFNSIFIHELREEDSGIIQDTSNGDRVKRPQSSSKSSFFADL